MAKCIFCGDHAGASHRIPHDYVAEVTERFPQGEALISMPYCVKFKELLGEVVTGSLEDAASYITSTCIELHSSALRHLKWSRAEMDKLGPKLRSAFEYYGKEHLEVTARVENCDWTVSGPEIQRSCLTTSSTKWA